jgi:hypothetical protein
MWVTPTRQFASYQAVYGPFKSRQATALFKAPKTGTCHLANQCGALSHAQRAGSVYKAAVWSTWDSVLDASLSYVYNGISSSSKISTDRPGSDLAGRPLIHPRNQHNPTGSKPFTAGRPELPAGLAAEAIPVFRQTSLCTLSTVLSVAFRDQTFPCVNPQMFHWNWIYLNHDYII